MIRGTIAIIKHERISILNVQLIKAIFATISHQNFKHVLLKSTKKITCQFQGGFSFSSKKYILVDQVNIAPWNIHGKNKKATCYSFFQGMFQLVQCPLLMINQDNVQALSCLRKKLYKTYNFTVITSSFLEVKAIGGFVFKSRSGAYFKIRVSWTRCYKHHIKIIIKPFLGVKRNSFPP